jgi:murein DD-endopeptidase MepM/ murein hydrolase activator NlpD
MIFIRLVLASALFISTLEIPQTDKSIFISPLKIPLLLSANFGELRIDHFHTGIDIRTQGVTGKEVVSAADGYVYMIAITPGGFGKALLIRHPSGYTTLYGHLERFAPEIQEYVINKQYENKSFTISLFPPKDKFVVKSGELIAYSGNSGGSGGPHLHFEIRKPDSQLPVNPLLFNFDIKDTIKPFIEKLAIYQVNKFTTINGKHSNFKTEVTGGNGDYSIPGDNEIIISGKAGFGIRSFDLLNESNNRCGVYSTELKIDSITRFKYKINQFSYAETRYINSHIDYESYINENNLIERTFVLPNDKLSLYSEVRNKGVFNFNDNKLHTVEILITDVNNNKSKLSFKVRAKSPDQNNNADSLILNKNQLLMPFNKMSKFISENFSVSVPANALYDTLIFTYKKTPGGKEMLSDLHHVHYRSIPLQKAATISIKPQKTIYGKESKMVITQLSDQGKKSTIASKWTDGYLTADIMNFGNYYIGADSIGPNIFPVNFSQGSDISGAKELRIKITDDCSGIKSYDPSIDGKWSLFDYDQKNDVLVYTFDEKRILKGIKHNIILRLSDNLNNITTYKGEFIW